MEAFHSRYIELHVTLEIPQKYSQNDEGFQSPSSNSMVGALRTEPSLDHMANMIFLRKYEQESWKKVCRYNQLIGSYEEEVKSLENQKAEIERIISDLQSSLEPGLKEQPECLYTKEEMMKKIASHRDTAAGIICRLTRAELIHMDILGLAGLLGSVDTSRLSRILAEYLGKKKMLAVVCRSFGGARALEKCLEDREVDIKRSEGPALLNSIKGRFLVICLERIRGYTGKLLENDPQRKLALRDPTLPDGKPLSGFLGYAVNMIQLDAEVLNVTTATGQGLRETLFYKMFGELQVYDTRKHMQDAAATTYLKNGAVSLDGGVISPEGFLYVGCRTPNVPFPIVNSLSNEDICILDLIEAKRQELLNIDRELERVNGLCLKARVNFDRENAKHTHLLHKMGPLMEDQCLDFQASPVNNAWFDYQDTKP